LNATEAAERAGYSKKTASQQSTRLFVKLGLILAPLLRAQQQQLAEEGGVSRTKWLKEIERVAFQDARKFFDTVANWLPNPQAQTVRYFIPARSELGLAVQGPSIDPTLDAGWTLIDGTESLFGPHSAQGGY
jgi:hypothetical protein